ncbi:hypothetical protein CMU89_17000 [Elizabethkingia anophelis]|nr:hypothetical protein [Elizabethkingia anophelis]MDV3544339.1 hypothetical protein [Elizabethkingia anophelis]
MTKTEAIKAAYGSHWEKVKYYVDENGWVEPPTADIPIYVPSIGKLEAHHGAFKFRPKSLSGIETNNGWTILNKETYDNLENSYYMWYNTNNGDWEVGDLDESFLQEYTHFQEIKLPPKPPIF